jgi:hypothetical protein
LASFVTGDGHPEKPLADVWAADARTAQICRSAGVVQCFQVSEYKVEPRPSKRARNLLSKDDWRLALFDEPLPEGPEVSLIVESFLAPRCGKRLTGRAARPHRNIPRPAREIECVRPSTDARKEVTREAEVVCAKRPNVQLAHVAMGQRFDVDELAKPARAERVGVVVVDEVHVSSILIGKM